VVQPTCPPANKNVMELLIMIDALKRASARRICAVLPYYGYARQDRKLKARDPITAKLLANIITAAGATRVLSMDLHAGQIQGFFDIPVDHLLGVPILAEYFQKIGIKDPIVVSPDVGGVIRARDLASRLETNIAIIDKRRPHPNETEVLHLVGDVKGKTAIVVDDIIDTGGTIVKAVDALIERGAKDVYACCSHPVLSGPARERLEASPLKEVVVTNTIPVTPEERFSRLKVLTVAPVFGEAIIRIHEDLSVSKLFE
jgi:ribose-phosphate pyrophosphokinase